MLPAGVRLLSDIGLITMSGYGANFCKPHVLNSLTIYQSASKALRQKNVDRLTG